MVNELSKRTPPYACVFALILAGFALTGCQDTRPVSQQAREGADVTTAPAPDNRAETGPAKHQSADDLGESPEHPELLLPVDAQAESGTSTVLDTTPLTKEALAKAIAGYVQRDSVLKGGFFLVYDHARNSPLALTLTGIHTDRLTRLKDGRYFACADFRAGDGRAYDLDFFMQGGGKTLSVTDVAIHKENGNDRYTWIEENGVWKREEVRKP